MSAEQLISQHLDLWASAIKRKSSAGRGSSSKVELYGIKKLRELILELAVRGLLVPQDPNDEPASELLKKIAAEKARLVKEGKIKKDKLISPKPVREIPFDIPKGWEWAVLPQICDYGPGKTPSTKNSVYWEEGEIGIPWVSISDMEHLRTLTQTAKRITPKAVADVFRSEPVAAGTMIMSFKLTLGKISKLGVDAYHNEAIIALRPYSGVCEDYVFNFLPGRALAGKSKAAIKGNTLNSESLAELLIPIPPAKEQHRIVAKVDELMALCDQLEQQSDASLAAHQTLVATLLNALTSAAARPEPVEGQSRTPVRPEPVEGGAAIVRQAHHSAQTAFGEAWQRIAEHFDTLFTTEESIDQLKQSILQLAVMGKLAPQDPNDEPASELLKKIAAEKARLVKEGKIKKEKPLPPIAEGEKPFALPSGWSWSRWNNVAKKIGDIDHKMPNEEPDGIPYVSPRDFYPNNVIDFLGAKKISRSDFDKLSVKIKPQRGDIIFPRYGTIGENVLVESDLDFLASYSCCVIKTLSGYVSEKYQFIYSISGFVKQQCRKAENKTTQPNVGIKSIQEFVVPLPPLAEQHRIVARVDKLMALCDQLKAGLSAAQTTQLQLADAMTEQALTKGSYNA